MSLLSILSRVQPKGVSQKALFLVVFAGFAGIFAGYSQLSRGGVECSTYTNTSQVPAGYAVPYDVFSVARDLLVRASCDATSATITAGTGPDGKYIYKYGYEWRNGAWQKYTFTGATPVGEWLQGTASVQLSRTIAEMSATNYVVAYTCQFLNNAWKCGCRDAACATPMWQLQAFTKPVDQGLPDANGIWGNYNELFVGFLSSQSAPPGTSITIAGAGFSTTNNTVMLGARSLNGIAATTIHGLTFTIPSDMPTGLVYVKVANDKGISSTSAMLMVTKPGATIPTVTSITPSSGPHGTRVTVRGTNFTPKNNYLIASYGIIEGLSSPDGTTITATLSPFPNNPEMQQSNTVDAIGKSYDFHIFVMNENGISRTSAIFKAIF